MTSYELAHLLAAPFLPVLYSRARRDLRALVGPSSDRPRILDIGGRMSPYTIGVRAQITILELPKSTEIQRELGLGLSTDAQRRIQRWRSNVERIVLEDVVESTLPDAAFDGVVAIETLEHVQHDGQFVQQVARLLRPGGWFFASTPNGDYVKNEPPHFNPDHIRHYTREGLLGLLRGALSDVQVVYAIQTGPNRYRGLRSIKLRRPMSALVTMVSNLRNRFESRGLDRQSRRTAHLIATARAR